MDSRLDDGAAESAAELAIDVVGLSQLPSEAAQPLTPGSDDSDDPQARHARKAHHLSTSSASSGDCGYGGGGGGGGGGASTSSESLWRQLAPGALAASAARRWRALCLYLSDADNVRRLPATAWGYLHPREPEAKGELQPWLPAVGAFLSRLLPLRDRRWWTLAVLAFFAAWIVGFVVLVVKSGYSATTDLGKPSLLSCTTTLWSLLDGCGPQGVYCTPFNGTELVFKCPASCADVYASNVIVSQRRNIIGTGFVVGSGVYRADSWICQAAIHHGVTNNANGGCGALRVTGAFTNYTGSKSNGIASYGFDSWFPKSFEFIDGVGSSGCLEQPAGMLAYNVVFLAVFVLLLRPPKQMLWWTLVVVGFWHIILASEPRRTDAWVSGAFSKFICALAMCFVLYRVAARHTLPANASRFPVEMALMMALFWVGVLWPFATNWLQFETITVKFITSSARNTIVFLVGLAIILGLFFIQFGIMRRRGHLMWFLLAYAIVAAVVVVMGAINKYLFLHLHHYIVAILLIPATRYENRLSIACLGVLLGLFLEGVARWGFDSPLETRSQNQAGGLFGSATPSWAVNATTWNTTGDLLTWSPIDGDAQANSFDGFSLLMNDAFEIYRGSANSFNISSYLVQDFIPYYFRVSFTQFGGSFDYNWPVTVFKNGTVRV